MFLYYT